MSLSDRDAEKLAGALKKESFGKRVKKLATLGGGLRMSKENSWLYCIGRSKKELHGCCGSLHPGMPNKEEMAVEATQSDTRPTLIKELIDQGGLSRREAEETVNKLIRDGILVEINDPDLGKILVRGK